jgi:predicted ferric reductase
MRTNRDIKMFFERWGGWVLIVLFTAIPIVRWLALAPLEERFATASLSFKAFGQVVGMIGFMLYAINLLLSIRKSWLEDLFGGLNRVYIAHHITGGLALVFILFHPVFLALRYIELTALVTIKDAARSILPQAIHFDRSFYEIKHAVAINNGIIAFIGMVGLLFVTFFVKLPYRFWLFTHKFLGVAFVFAGLHILLIVSDVSNDTFLKIYFAAWIITGFAAFMYRTVLGNILVRRVPYRVASASTLPGNIVQISLDPISRPLDFKPGQFVFIRFINDSVIANEAHPFSIASVPREQSGQLRIYVKALGDFTTSLKQLKAGTTAEVEGAFGRFLPARFDDVPQIWVAGGIGITPFLSIARNFSSQKPKVDMFYTVQTRAELVDQEALRDFLPQHYPQFRYHTFVNEEQKGFLTAQYIAEQAGGIEGKEIFLCGPPAMMKSLRQQLKAMKIPNNKIHSEEFSMS